MSLLFLGLVFCLSYWSYNGDKFQILSYGIVFDLLVIESSGSQGLGTPLLDNKIYEDCEIRNLPHIINNNHFSDGTHEKLFSIGIIH